MKGLLKYLSPFAPDQSGAAAVLYNFGGLLIICDAGGCAGEVRGRLVRPVEDYGPPRQTLL